MKSSMSGCSAVKGTGDRDTLPPSAPPPPLLPRTTKHPQQDFLLHVAMAAKVGRVRLPAVWRWCHVCRSWWNILSTVMIMWGLFCLWRLIDPDLHSCLFSFGPADWQSHSRSGCAFFSLSFAPESISTGRSFPAQHLGALLTHHRSSLASPSAPHTSAPPVSSSSASSLLDCPSSVLLFTAITRADSGY